MLLQILAFIVIVIACVWLSQMFGSWILIIPAVILIVWALSYFSRNRL